MDTPENAPNRRGLAGTCAPITRYGGIETRLIIAYSLIALMVAAAIIGIVYRRRELMRRHGTRRG